MTLPTAPQKSSGPNIGLVVALGVALGGLIVAAVVVAGAAFLVARGSGHSRHARGLGGYGRSATGTGAQGANSRSYSMANGMAVVHFPPGFAAQSIDRDTLMIRRKLADGRDEVVAVAAVPHPLSTDVNEFSRLLIDLMKKKLADSGYAWTETSRQPAPCFKGFPGLEVNGTFQATPSTLEKVHICFYVDSEVGYELKTVVPEADEAAELPVLQSIVEATEMK
jgi:hypothetical protein